MQKTKQIAFSWRLNSGVGTKRKKNTVNQWEERAKQHDMACVSLSKDYSTYFAIFPVSRLHKMDDFIVQAFYPENNKITIISFHF